MIVYHATTRQNLPSIQAQGLLVSKADTAAKIKGVWLHTASFSPWAVVHTMRKHGAALEDVVVVQVRVARTALTRFRTGLWYTTADISAKNIERIIDGAAFGASASE